GNKKFELKAEMMDENNAKITNYNESVNFEISEGFPNIIKYQTSNTPGLTTTFSGGEVIIGMKSVNEAGTAKIEASSTHFGVDILGTLSVPVGITLILADPPNIVYDAELELYYVSFYIDIQGAELELEEMQVSWSINETLDKSRYK
ncbi:unnamed protein product, partial [marine sediment metagenome]